MRMTKFYRLTVMNVIEKDFFHEPTDDEILHAVEFYFPGFICNGELVYWKVETYYQPMI